MRSALDSLLSMVERQTLTPWRIEQAADTLLRYAGSRRFSRALRRVQKDRLAETFRWVKKRSPYYGYRLEEESLEGDPEEVLARLPLTKSKHLEAWRDFLCVPEDEISAVHTTSGTTGEPKIIAFTYEELQRLFNIWALGMMIGQRHPMKALIALPSTHGLWIGTAAATRAMERAGGLPIPVGTPVPPETLGWMRRLEPNILISSPSYLAALTRCAEKEGYRPRMDRLVVGGELLDDQRKDMLEQFWGGRVVNSYGTTEIGGPQTVALPGCKGLHVNELQLIVEIDGDGNSPEGGDLLFTTLKRTAMPLIRFRSGDRARWVSCGCGLPLRCIELLGRSDDMFIAGGEHMYAQLLADSIAGVPRATGRAEIVLERKESIDRLLLRVEGDASVEALRSAVFEKYPRLRENEESGNLLLEVQSGAVLSEQVKAFRIFDRRG